MNALNTQIKAIYEQGATIEQILSAFPELDKDAVETMLMSCSRKFQKEHKDDALYTRAHAEMVRDISLDLVQDPDTPAPTRAKLLQFIINEQKGRNDVLKDTARAIGGVNVSVINIHLQRARERLAEAKSAKIIDLPREDQQLMASAQ